MNICLICLDSLPLSSWGLQEAHFQTPSWTIIGLLSVSCLLVKSFFLSHRMNTPMDKSNYKPWFLFVPFYCIYWSKKKDALLWRRDAIISETSCDGKTLRWSPLSPISCYPTSCYPMSLCNLLTLSVGRTCDLLLSRRKRQSWEVISLIMLNKTLNSSMLEDFLHLFYSLLALSKHTAPWGSLQ